MKTNTTINPNHIRTRDVLIQKLIQGATKSGIHLDKRKEANRKACRRPIQED